MHTLDNLSTEAKLAYQAFLDMSTSKQAHFQYLKSIETKYESGGAPSLTEKLELEKLLTVHDKNVLAFKTAMSGVIEQEERQTLVRLMS